MERTLDDHEEGQQQTVFDPGWRYVASVMSACILVNLFLPVLVAITKPKKKGKNKRSYLSVNDSGADIQEDNNNDQEKTYRDVIAENTSWDKEMKKLISLWVPYTISGAVGGFFDIINVGIISHYVGTKEANAYIMVNILVEFTGTLTYGWGEAVGTLGPQADGVGNKVLIGRYLQLGIIFTIITSIPGIIIWSLYAEDAVMWFGFDEETAIYGQRYVYPLLAVIIINDSVGVIEEFLYFIGHEKYGTMMTVLLYALQTAGLIVLTTIFGVKDLFYIGVLQTGIGFLVSMVDLTYIAYRGWLDDYWEGFANTNGLKDKKAVRNITKTAIPIAIMYILTYGEWEVMTFFASHMGPNEVAAWGMVGYVWDTFEYIIGGLSDAAEVRVGFHMGAAQINRAKAASYKAMYLAVVIAMYGSGLLFVISAYLPAWLTPDPTLQKMIFDLLPLIGFGQIAMSVGLVSWNILSAQGLIRLSTIIEFVVSWLLVMPLSAVLVYVFNFNLFGMVGPLVLGYTIGGVAVCYILFTSDWESLSAKVILRNGGNVTYDEYDWDDLPETVKTAATLLGYNANVWDEDEEPESESKTWDDLTTKEKKAAKRLGFDRDKWDNDDTESTHEVEEKGYDNYDWLELPKEVRKAAMVLGYTEELWDRNQDPASCEKYWHELTREEQDAAMKLSYNEKEWNGSDSTTADEADSRAETSQSSRTTNSMNAKKRIEMEAVRDVCYDHYDWKDLPKDIRKAARVLGYTKKIWNGSLEPIECDKYWEDLTQIEQNAAKKLGYDEMKWNVDSDVETENNFGVRLEYITNTGSEDKELIASRVSYEDYRWKELPDEVREAAITLGYTKKKWDKDKEPKKCYKYWTELSETEKEAALMLGYDHKRWNEDFIFDDTETGQTLVYM